MYMCTCICIHNIIYIYDNLYIYTYMTIFLLRDAMKVTTSTCEYIFDFSFLISLQHPCNRRAQQQLRCERLQLKFICFFFTKKWVGGVQHSCNRLHHRINYRMIITISRHAATAEMRTSATDISRSVRAHNGNTHLGMVGEEGRKRRKSLPPVDPAAREFLLGALGRSVLFLD
ncbi:hypothetical protein T492DRAFT_401139 [Pavlovales sp. CCMP2436]|nr:hypothetical protein T492DRAFT_401139 [Pavlovales sp. CCMP2436]